MTIALTDAGLETETQEEVGAGIRAGVRATIGDALALEADTPIGEVIENFANKTATVQEAFRAVYNGLDPAHASGSLLEGISAMTGTTRGAATPSEVSATVTVEAGTYAIGDLVAHVVGSPASRFANAEEVVNAGPGSLALGVLFKAETPGATRALAGTLTVIASPVTGWLSITNAEDAELGLEVETNPQLRARRRTELPAQGSATAAAVAAAVLRDVPGVTAALGFENDTDNEVGGIPPHAIEILVSGAPSADEDIAATILRAKAGGIRAFGSTVVNLEDSQGFQKSIGFTRPADVTLYARFTLEVLSSYAGPTTFKARLVELASAFYTLGVDVAPSKVGALAHQVEGVFNVVDVELSTNGTTWTSAKVAILPRQVAAFDTSRVTVLSATVVVP